MVVCPNRGSSSEASACAPAAACCRAPRVDKPGVGEHRRKLPSHVPERVETLLRQGEPGGDGGSSGAGVVVGGVVGGLVVIAAAAFFYFRQQKQVKMVSAPQVVTSVKYDGNYKPSGSTPATKEAVETKDADRVEAPPAPPTAAGSFTRDSGAGLYEASI